MINFFKINSYDVFKMLLNQIGIALLALVMTMATHQNDQLYLITSILCIIFYMYLLYTMTYSIGQTDKPRLDGRRMKLQPLRGLWLSLAANAINIICGIMIAVFSVFIVMQSPVAVTDQTGNDVKLYTRAEIATAQSSDETADTAQTDIKYTYTEVVLYSDKGGNAKTSDYDSAKYSEVVGSDLAVVSLYDEDGNEVELYTDNGMKLCTAQKSVENWASNLYGIPYVIATFFQSMYAGVRSEVFANSDFFFLFTSIPALIFCTLAYYNGATGKRILFFLPERKSKPSKR